FSSISKMNDKINYTAEDIRLYLDGKMSPEQMHALEKAALNDPFLADALEGMELHGDSIKFNADIEDLRARLAGKSKSRTGALASMNSLWWKIVAVLFIVVTGVAVIIFTGRNENLESKEIAKTEDKLAAKDQEIKPQAVQPDSVLTSSITKEELAPTFNTKKQVSARKSKRPALYNKIDLDSVSSPEEVNVQHDISRSAQPSAASREDTIAKALQGKVAGLAVANEKVPDSGYDEVIVIGYGTTAKNAKRRTVPAGRAEKRVVPGNGWDEFEQYIEDSTNINTADSVYSGEEHLSFTIGDDGLPESIKILRSISPSHDREAIRLLQNGPSWKIAKGRKREVRLKLIF
ncbi:MAG TPA: hypothetical protein VHL77_09155, partial [Ferruginibacter sp.]|nr:hypothetical protein [Ferruginibacter sp.]